MRAAWSTTAGAAAAVLLASLIGSPTSVAAETAPPPPMHHRLYATNTMTTATVTDVKRHLVYAIDPDGLLAVLHTKTGRLRTIVVGDDPASLALDKPSGRVYVVNTTSHDVTIVRDEQVLGTITLGRHTGPTAILPDPPRRLFYVADTGNDHVSIISGKKLVATRHVGKQPAGLAELNGKVYVSNSGDGTLSVLKGTAVEKEKIAVGGVPGALAANPDTREIYVLDPIASSVLVVRKNKLNKVIELRAESTPSALVVSVPTGTVDVLEAGRYTPPSDYVPPGVAILVDRTLIGESVSPDVSPTGLAVDPHTGDVVIGANRAKDGIALHGIKVIAAGNARFSGVAMMHHGRLFAGTGSTTGGAPGIMAIRLP